MVYPTTAIRDSRTLQEVITTLRTVIDLRRVYNINSASYWVPSPAALIVRGTADAVEASARLVKQADSDK